MDGSKEVSKRFENLLIAKWDDDAYLLVSSGEKLLLVGDAGGTCVSQLEF